MGETTVVYVLDNDFDIDNDAIQISHIVTRPGLNAQIVGNSIQVTPAQSSIQPIIFDYSITDNNGTSDTASVTVSITCDEYTTQGIAFVCINAGTFEMGSYSTEIGHDPSEGPVRIVTITNDFYLSKYEITKGDWERVGAANLSIAAQGLTSHHPVIDISWDDINKVDGFLDKLNEASGCDTSVLPGDISTRYHPSNIPSGCFRLPTEAECEFAARAGSTTRYSFGDDETQLNLYALYDPDTDDLVNAGSANPVGQFRPNDYGLYDMHGNIREWVYDKYANSYIGRSSIDPSGPLTGAERVLRGGSWYVSSDRLRSASRDQHDTNHSGSTTGFRLLLVRY